MGQTKKYVRWRGVERSENYKSKQHYADSAKPEWMENMCYEGQNSLCRVVEPVKNEKKVTLILTLCTI